jgi:hypothetical protein
LRGAAAASIHPVKEEVSAMPLEMRESCERCQSPLPKDSEAANICSYECTFCRACTETMAGRCPNCGGELLRRPRRGT